MAIQKYLKFFNGIKMPNIGYGTWRAPDAEVESALNQALEAGYRHIDCAPVYRNEQVIGKVLKQWIDSGKVNRDDLFITTKLPPMGNRASTVEKYLKKSLADLELSYIDLYLIHTPFALPDTDGDFHRHENGDLILDTESNHIETWKVMEAFVSAGLIKSIGISNFNQRQIQRILDNSTIRPACLQVELHIYCQQIELVEFCNDNDIAVVAYAPLGSRGIAELYKGSGNERDIPDLLDIPEVKEIAERHNKTVAQVLLRWILQRGVATIPKSTNPIRLQQNLDLYGFALSDEDMVVLRGLDRGFRVCNFGFFQGITKHPEFPW